MLQFSISIVIALVAGSEVFLVNENLGLDIYLEMMHGKECSSACKFSAYSGE